MLLSVLAPLVTLDKILQVGGDLGQLHVAPPRNLARDIFRDIPRPALGNIKADHSNRRSTRWKVLSVRTGSDWQRGRLNGVAKQRQRQQQQDSNPLERAPILAFGGDDPPKTAGFFGRY
jgi:hypothetical protein